MKKFIAVFILVVCAVLPCFSANMVPEKDTLTKIVLTMEETKAGYLGNVEGLAIRVMRTASPKIYDVKIVYAEGRRFSTVNCVLDKSGLLNEYKEKVDFTPLAGGDLSIKGIMQGISFNLRGANNHDSGYLDTFTAPGMNVSVHALPGGKFRITGVYDPALVSSRAVAYMMSVSAAGYLGVLVP